jgi:hypothetical protein
MTALLPSQLLYIAAQFASKDEWKGIITAIHVERNENQISIFSTDGFRAFRVSFDINENYYMDEEELTLDATSFKKRIPKGKVTLIENEMATVKDSKNDIVVSTPYKITEGTYPNINQIWPDTFHNESKAPITFDSSLLGPFLTEMSRYGVKGHVKMEFNTPLTPLQFSGTIEAFGDTFEVEFLLMPIQVRE